MHKHGFTLLGLAGVAIGMAALLWTAEAEAQGPYAYSPEVTTGLWWYGGNALPHTGIGIVIPFSQADSIAQFMDWRTLQMLRVESAALQLLGEVNFAFNSSEVSADFQPLLDQSAQLLLENPEVSLVLVGHADLVGPTEYNHRLGQRRAEALRAALVARGVNAERLTATSRGELLPVDPTSGRSLRNRRVEIDPRVNIP